MFRIAVVAILIGASSAPLVGAVAGTITQASVGMPGVDVQVPRAEASITPLDRLTVSVFREPELSVEDVLVDESGRIVLPLVGGMSAAGQSTDALATGIASKLRQYVRNPQVSVAIKQAASRRVTVA